MVEYKSSIFAKCRELDAAENVADQISIPRKGDSCSDANAVCCLDVSERQRAWLKSRNEQGVNPPWLKLGMAGRAVETGVPYGQRKIAAWLSNQDMIAVSYGFLGILGGRQRCAKYIGICACTCRSVVFSVKPITSLSIKPLPHRPGNSIFRYIGGVGAPRQYMQYMR